MSRLAFTEPGAALADEPGHRRRVSSETRRTQILAVARKAFAVKGYRGTTTKEIAATAGITEALLFQHFATKRDLYASILEAKAGESPIKPVLEALRSHAERRDDQAFLEEYARASLARSSADGDFMRLMLYSSLEGHEMAQEFREQQVKPMLAELRRYIALRQQEGAFRKGPATSAARAFAGMIGHYAIVKAIFGPAEAELTEKRVIREFTELFLDGMSRKSMATALASRSES